MRLSFNLFLYIEELNCCCCWEVWTVCHCWKEALFQCFQSDCELRFLEQWRCTVLPSASFVFETFSLLQVFTTNTCSIRYIKPTLHIFQWDMWLRQNHTKHHVYCKQGVHVGQKSQMLRTKETECENLKHISMVCIVPFLKDFFNDNAKPLICYRPVP